MKSNRTVVAISLVCIFLGFNLPAHAELELVRAEFELKVAQVEQKIESILTRLYGGYLKQLDMYEQNTMKAGDLEGTLVYRNEKQRFATEGKVSAENISSNPKLQRLQRYVIGQSDKADTLRAGETEKLVKQFLVDLGQLSMELTKAGNIKEAVAVKAEQDEVNVRYAPVLVAQNAPTRRPDPRQPAPRSVSRSLQEFKARFPHLASSVKVYYDFEDSVGAVDLAGNVNGSLSNVENVELGHHGRGLSFDGSGSVSLGKNNLLTSMNVGTISFWVKTRKAGGVMASCFQRSSSSGFRIGIGGDGTVQGSLGYDSSYSSYYSSSGSYGKVNTARKNYATSKTVITDGEWHHIAFVKEENKIFLYVDGDKGSSSYTERNLMDTGAEFRLSGYSYYYTSTVRESVTFSSTPPSIYSSSSSSSYNPYVGEMDDFMIFDQAMTGQMIKSIYSSQR